jgi:retinol dehydrogenase 12
VRKESNSAPFVIWASDMSLLEESTPPANRWVRLAMCSFGQRRTTPRCPPTPRLDGKRALVTGGTNGIGVEIARGLLARGADLILPCRDLQKGNRVREALRHDGDANARIDLVPMDLADLDSVRGAARQVAEMAARIDLLVENAGVMERVPARTPQGYERTFGINVLGHFALRQRLLEAGRLAAARVVVLTGDIYALQSDCTPDYAWRGAWGGLMAYCRSKLGNLWIAAELQRRHPELTVLVVHPGAIATDLGGNAGAVGNWFKRAVMLSAELGAQTPLVCATQDDLCRGGYYHNRFGLVRLREHDPARDAAAAASLWALCEQLAAA